MRIAGSTKAKNGVQGKVQRIVQGLYLLMLVCLVLSTISCNEENWELINPGATGNTILVRWINAVPNSQPLTLTLNETTSTAATAAGVIAKTIAAPADSTFLVISENQTQKLRYNGRYKFVRNSVETIIGVSGAAATAKEQQLDTIISLTTIRGQNTKSTSAFLRTVVVANDSPAVYSVQQGCPNGKVIGSEMRFKQSTEYVELQPGTFVFSLMRSGFLENVFETTTLTAQKYYTLVISGTKTARAVQLIDEFDTTANAVTIPRTIDAANRTAFIRTVNISRTNVGKVVVSGTQTVAQSLSARAVSAYTTVVACESSTADNIQLYNGAVPVDSTQASLGVLARYTAVVFDSNQSSQASKLLLIPPYTSLIPQSSAVVRVVNTVASKQSIKVRLGARTDDAAAFHNGEQIANTTPWGSVSTPVVVPAGVAPITIVSGTQPEQLIGSVLGTFQAGKEYVLFVGTGAKGELEVSALRSDEENTTLSTLERGAFVQIVHARAELPTTTVFLGTTLKTAQIQYGSSIATVLPLGSHQCGSQGVTQTIQIDTAQRTTLIVTGTEQRADLLNITTYPMNAQPTDSRYRFLNAIQGSNPVRVTIDSSNVREDNYNAIRRNLTYGDVSSPNYDAVAQRKAYFISDEQSNKELLRTLPFSLALQKSYTLIIAGSEKAGYTMIINQEF